MGGTSTLPLRWDAGAAPPDLPLPVPPARLPPLRGRRPLKRWRYVAAFSDELMLCAATASVGPARSAWWAVWDRGRGVLAERTRLLRTGGVRFERGGRLTVRDRRVAIDLFVDEGCAVESLNAHGAQYVWTRKQAGRPARGQVVLDGHTIQIDGPAVVDDTAGYHARETEWWWSAGVGHTVHGGVVGWNVVVGVNDGTAGSERSLWVDGNACELGPVRIAADLRSVSFAEAGALAFSEEAARARRDGLLLVLRSDYRQPFGRYEGSLPGIGRVVGGLGIMEHHIARW